MIRNAFKSKTTGSAWVGLNDLDEEGRWYWITAFGSNKGELATDSNTMWLFKPEERSFIFDCGPITLEKFLVSTGDCDFPLEYMCEKRK